MNIGVLGTGGVGQTIAAKLAEIGHSVMIGTRNVQTTLAHTEPDVYGNPPFSVWYKNHGTLKLGSYADTAAFGEVLINATSGSGSLAALSSADAASLNGKILIDIANPLDFSKGMPPSLFVSNTDSLGEQIQHQFPTLKVVKTLNTVTAALMVNPRLLADGEHEIFVGGNDAEAKAIVTGYLKQWFGWKHVLDLGDITSARGTEMYLPIWLRLWGTLQTNLFNVRVVR